MGIYLLKTAACMGIFLLFYKLFLEKESMHIFKRYFLLGSILISLAIPYVVFTEIVYIEPINVSSLPTEDYSLEKYHIPSKAPIDYTYWSLLSIYCLGVLFFGIQFIKNLYQIKNTINNNPKQRTNCIIKVLLSLDIVPHTFFNYIFLNKQKFEGNEIPSAVLLHEETHAKQKHSLDILIIEILQVIFWFNPLIYLYKKSIKLNHEFLADKAVLNNGLEKSDYQKILLAFSSNAAEPQLANAINYSSIKKRFTVMKKQTSKKVYVFKSLLILPILALLLLGFSEKETLEVQKEQNLISDINKELENVDASKLNYTKEKEQIIELYIKKNAEIFIQNNPVLLEDLATTLENKIQPNINLENVRVEGLTEDTLESEFMLSIIMEIEKAKIKHIKFCTSEYKINAEDYKDEIEITPETVILNADKISFQSNNSITYNSLAKKYNAVPIEERVIPLKDLHVLETIYRSLSADQKKQVQPFPECLPKNKQEKPSNEITININNKGQLLVQGDLITINELKEYLSKINKHLSFDERKKVIRSIIKVDTKTPKDVIQKANDILMEYGTATINIVGRENSMKSSQQKTATREEMKAYNRLAKKYNEMDRNHMQIKMQDVQRLKTIYSKMSTKQREDAQPFPDFPEPPKTPKEPKAPKVLKEEKSNIPLPPPPPPPFHKGEVSKSLVNTYNTWVKTIKKADGTYYINSKEDYSYFYSIYESMTDEQKNNALKMPPPPPPAPKSPLDFVVEMAKKGATFMYEGDNISSDKAIDLMKNNKELNIDSRTKNGERVIKITKDPILISNDQEASTNKNVNTYIKERNKLLNYIKVNNIDYPVGYLALSKLEQTEFNKIQQAMFQAYMDLSENEKQSAPKILPPPPSAKMYKLEDGKVVKKV
ncbi:M56 family metallopeptidase [Maribacter sp. MAR_2009_72]|uniref:M56 family metallopeptidase n=1 Tax=Maribacter sp. MAR_2009_72 TaxID=1250050 RepID=UPI00119AFFCB|nr:M56 family metallopeptidase [Maribacter sp. MAR_2009_72]TVZ16636.1 BlaR1 peptidase M56 [Maribacter sp. MAR_2009_72]